MSMPVSQPHDPDGGEDEAIGHTSDKEPVMDQWIRPETKLGIARQKEGRNQFLIPVSGMLCSPSATLPGRIHPDRRHEPLPVRLPLRPPPRL
jgi:hypothetical protein